MTLGDARRAIAAFMERAFVPREVFFRSRDRFDHLCISVRAQKVAAALAVLALVWVLYASVSYGVHSFMLASRQAEIERHKLAYFDLLAEVSEYHTQFAKITQDLEENQAYLLSLLEQDAEGGGLAEVQNRLKSSATEHARAVIAREGLRDKMESFESDLLEIAGRNLSLKSQVAQMRALVDSSRAERDEVAQARERLVERLSAVERELGAVATAKGELEGVVADLRGALAAAERENSGLLEERSGLTMQIAAVQARLSDTLSEQANLEDRMSGLNASLADALDRGAGVEQERDYLARRVAGLEQRLVDLRDAEQTVIQRLNQRTRLSIGVIEKTVEMTGLDVNALIASVGDSILGQGGPFVPLSDQAADFEPSVELEASVTHLDRQLDRWTALQEVLRRMPLTAPLDQYRISSSYGTRRDPINSRKARHLGVDFAAPRRTSVYATAPGKVVYAGWRGRYGRSIEIDHGYGLRTRYGHLRKILVEAGQEVGHRERIGQVGSSGRSTGPHVHYEVRYLGKPRNPMKFLKAGRYVFKG